MQCSGISAARWHLRIVSLFALALGTTALPLESTAMTFGVRCQASYQNDWQRTWDNTSDCTDFSNGMYAKGLTRRFNYVSNGMQSAQPVFVDPWDSVIGGPDSVDFLLISVHGGTSATSFSYPFWDQNVWWVSSQAKIGNNGYGARIFASYSCGTMNFDTTARLANMFSGGLLVSLGSYNVVYDGCRWGDRLQSYMDSYGAGDAWVYALKDSTPNNYPVAWSIGDDSDLSDCFVHMQTTYSGLMSQPHNPDFNYFCYEWL